MTVRALLSLSLFVAASALAQVPTTKFYDGMPPARFMGPASTHIVFGRLDLCGKPERGYFEACVRGKTTYLPDPCTYGDREEFARLACHELAHIRRWPADHGE